VAERRLGVVAAGHRLSARAGAQALRAGGNAVDAALGAMLTAFACEPLLTGLGAGGYMLIRPPGGPPLALDFFVEAPGRGGAPREPAELEPVAVSFGGAVQEFHVGVASAGCYGMPAGIVAASERFGSLPLGELVAPAATLAREGVALNGAQAYVVRLLSGIVTSTPECAALYAPGGELLGEGARMHQPELAAALELLAGQGAAPFYTGELARAVVAWVRARGGLLSLEDLAAYRVLDREPVRVAYRGREVATNPPPSAGGILIARALALLEDVTAPPGPAALVAAMERVQGERDAAFAARLHEPGFARRFLKRPGGAPLGSTTHVSAIDAGGLACAVTCSNGSSSGVIVPGTGIHLNNMLGEQDLNPLGFHRHPPGRRLPSMMAPTIVSSGARAELVLGSAGSNRIRSAILQTIVRVIDEGMTADHAVRAPRLHYEDGIVFAEPGIETEALERAGRTIAPFSAPNLFFGGVQAAQQDERGRLWGGGDPRRGGDAVVL
jgi:gamma-glutamyltranspeptidase/glutathione hydrolase